MIRRSFCSKIYSIINRTINKILNFLQCMICNLVFGNSYRCSQDDCDTWFHVSCGILAGFDFKIDQIKRKISIYCKEHMHTFTKASSFYSRLCLLYNNNHFFCYKYSMEENYIKTKWYGRDIWYTKG